MNEPETAPGPTIIVCETELPNGRKIKAKQWNGVFRITIKAGRKTRKIEMFNDEAWTVWKMISAMHPHTFGSNDPLWHEIQERRKTHNTLPGNQ